MSEKMGDKSQKIVYAIIFMILNIKEFRNWKIESPHKK
jgi:hypothetical protein